jgi:hypothetical protein
MCSCHHAARPCRLSRNSKGETMSILDAYKRKGLDYIYRILGAAPGALWNVIEFVRWPLPSGPAHRTGVVAALALLPLLPIELLEEDRVVRPLSYLAIALALLALGDRVIASVQIARVGRLSIRAKQMGGWELQERVSTELEKELGKTSWSGLPLIVFILVGVACTVVIAMSSVTWSLINHVGYSGPFWTQPPSQLSVLLYFVDEAARGLTFRLLADLGITLPEKLEAAPSVRFTLMMWAYKAGLTLLTIQVVWLWIISMFTERDPEVVRLVNMNDSLFDEKLELERKNIFANQYRHHGRLTRVDRKNLRWQRGYYRSDRAVMEQIQRSFRWHNQVTARSFRPEKGTTKENKQTG